MERKFLAADIEGIESIDAVAAVFDLASPRLSELFAGLILADHEVARLSGSNPLRPL